MHRSIPWLALFLLLFLSGCVDFEVPSDVPLGVEEPDLMVNAEPARERRIYELPPGAPSRRDTHWWPMSDEELADSVAAYDGRVFIGFKEPMTPGGVDDWGNVSVSSSIRTDGRRMLESLGLEIERTYQLTPTVVTVIPPSLIGTLRTHALIDYVEPVTRIQFDEFSHVNTPRSFASQSGEDTTWNVWRVRGPETWSTTKGGGAKLLVIDRGIYNTHPDLDPAVIQSCVSGSNGVDTHGHGTHVAGIAAALDNETYVIGVSPEVELWSSHSGGPQYTADDVKCAVEFGRLNNVHVINMSFRAQASTALTDEIKGAYGDGIFLTKSAGNTNGGSVTYPGNLHETVAVTALDINNDRASFAAMGSEVELAAPGVEILSTALPSGASCSQGNLTGLCSGTSMAAAHVSAAASLLKAHGPNWSNVEIRQRLRLTADSLGMSVPNDEIGFGLIDIRAALDFNYVPPVPPSNVVIVGPDEILPGATCTWDAIVSGGDPPFQYSWTGPIQPWGSTQPSFTGAKDSGHTSPEFTIRVDVANSGGSVWDEFTVTESSGAEECVI